jgi:hypothetical protein
MAAVMREGWRGSVIGFERWTISCRVLERMRESESVSAYRMQCLQGAVGVKVLRPSVSGRRQAGSGQAGSGQFTKRTDGGGGSRRRWQPPPARTATPDRVSSPEKTPTAQTIIMNRKSQSQVQSTRAPKWATGGGPHRSAVGIVKRAADPPAAPRKRIKTPEFFPSPGKNRATALAA